MTFHARLPKSQSQGRYRLALAPLAVLLLGQAEGAQVSSDALPVYPELQVAGVLDYDGDGSLEMLGTEARTGALGAYRIDPFGRPVLERTLAEAGFALRSVISADMDGDGLNDLVGIGGYNSIGTIVVFYDRGGDLFEPFVSIAQTDRSDQLLATDFDADGNQDLLVYPASELLADPQGTTDTIRLVRNLGAGAFDAATSVLSFPEMLRNAAPLDLDQDGDVDFAAIRPNSGTLVVARNTGTVLQILAIPASAQDLQDIAIGDVNGDSVDDVVTLRALPSFGDLVTLDLYLGIPGGTLAAPIELLANEPNAELDVSTLDVDGDGALDIVLSKKGSQFDSPSLLLLPGDGVGGFGAPITRFIRDGSQRTRSRVGELNGDGLDDLVQGIQRENSSVDIPVSTIAFVGTTDAGGPVLAEETVFTASIDSRRFADGHLNGDGIIDLVAQDGKGLVGLLGVAGSNYFGRPQLFAEAPANFKPLLVAGFDSNNREDVVGISTDQFGVETLGVLFTSVNITTSFYFPIDTYGGGSVDRLVAADWDGDGDLDLMGPNGTSEGIEWYENQGAGAFTTAMDIDLGPSVDVVADFLVEDFNGDGRLDIALSRGLFTFEITWHEGLGAGLAGPEQVLNSAMGPIAAADLNADGLPDLVFVNASALGASTIQKINGSPAGLLPQDTVTLVSDASITGRLELATLSEPSAPALIFLRPNGAIWAYVEAALGFYSSTRTDLAPPQLGANGQGINDALFALADVGGDGDTDFVVGSESSGVLWHENENLGSVGTSYCGPAVLNSIGASGRMLALGSSVATVNVLQLHAVDLPALVFGFFIASQTAIPATPAAASSGRICLGGQVGRFVGPGQILNSGFYGSAEIPGAFSLRIDLANLPSPSGFIPAIPGSTWNFQAWHRDFLLTGPTSNFTDAVSVTF